MIDVIHLEIGDSRCGDARRILMYFLDGFIIRSLVYLLNINPILYPTVLTYISTP